MECGKKEPKHAQRGSVPRQITFVEEGRGHGSCLRHRFFLRAHKSIFGKHSRITNAAVKIHVRFSAHSVFPLYSISLAFLLHVRNTWIAAIVWSHLIGRVQSQSRRQPVIKTVQQGGSQSQNTLCSRTASQDHIRSGPGPMSKGMNNNGQGQSLEFTAVKLKSLRHSTFIVERGTAQREQNFVSFRFFSKTTMSTLVVRPHFQVRKATRGDVPSIAKMIKVNRSRALTFQNCFRLGYRASWFVLFVTQSNTEHERF